MLSVLAALAGPAARAQDAPPPVEAPPVEAPPVEVVPLASAPPAPRAVEPPAFAAPRDIERWLDSVVMLITGPAWCSGVVIDDQGTVATAYHCVASGLRPQVHTRGGDVFVGRTQAGRPREDVALISVPELAGVVAPLAVRPDLPARGERVYGLGHPYAPVADRGGPMEGMLLWSVTEGIVSATGPHLIQTDAALNPGNSGGPVVDSTGRIIGICSRKLSGDNLAFAASSAQLRALVAQPARLRPLGGQWFVGLGLLSGQSLDGALALEVLGGAALRDRVVVQAGAAFALDGVAIAEAYGASWAPAGELSVAARQRLGRGRWSTTFDLGVGGYALSTYEVIARSDGSSSGLRTPLAAISPGVVGRVGFGGAGVRLVALEPWAGPTWMLSVDLDVPGVLGTF